ncbi:MAG TPA: hypothetical protein VF006_23775 [Longimicrobium sp.]
MTPMTTIRRSLPRLAAAALLLAAACSSLEPPINYPAVPGILELGPSDPPRIEIPGTARVGEAVTVRVTTYGGGCSRAAMMEIESDGAVIDLRPLDHEPPRGENVFCTRELRLLPAESIVFFTRPGTGTVRIHGRRMPGGEAVTLTRTVTVQ